jgi:hypothetical protein
MIKNYVLETFVTLYGIFRNHIKSPSKLLLWINFNNLQIVVNRRIENSHFYKEFFYA